MPLAWVSFQGRRGSVMLVLLNPRFEGRRSKNLWVWTLTQLQILESLESEIAVILQTMLTYGLDIYYEYLWKLHI
jgi:hypothetical protein